MEGGGVLISEENILRALVRSRNANRREEAAYKVHTWPFDLLKERKAGIVCSP